MRVLPDTSVWVEYLRVSTGGPAERLDRLLDEGSAMVCGPVAAEVVAGASTQLRPELWRRLSGLPWYDLERGDWREAGALAAELRARGLTVPLTDMVIAVASARADAALWTRDRHFETIRTVLPELDLYDPRS